jgi:prevent-host-death family protein
VGPVNIHDAKTHFSRLVERAERGEEIVIARNGKPVARIVPLEKRRLQLGRMAGKIWIADDFNDPLPPELQRYFEGEDDDPE